LREGISAILRTLAGCGFTHVPHRRLHIDRASFDFAQDEDGLRVAVQMAVRNIFILSVVEGRTASIQADRRRRRENALALVDFPP
jgi:hypothetical protein